MLMIFNSISPLFLLQEMQVFEHYLSSVTEWMRANKLKLNADKIETLLLGELLDWLEGNLSDLNGVNSFLEGSGSQLWGTL